MTGQVIMREPPIPVEVDAYIDGVVTEVMPGEGVVIEAEGAFLQGIFGVGGETIGPLDDGGEGAGRGAHRGPLQAGAQGEGRHRRARSSGIPALRRAIEVGVKAVVVGGIDDQDLRALLGYDLGVAITGRNRSAAPWS